MLAVYNIEDFVLHNKATGAVDDSLHIVTPAGQWAYAAELPLLQSTGFPVRTRMIVDVTSGSIGVGSVKADGSEFFHEVQIAASDGQTTIDLMTGADADAGSVIIRNTSTANRASEVRIQIVETAPATDQDLTVTSLITAGPDIDIDPSAFSRFKSWSGMVPAGYWADWAGSLTSTQVWAFNEQSRDIYARERHESPTPPMDSEHVLDWLPLAQAVVAAGDTFRMAALGAGWGRWLVAGGLLAEQLGKDYRLVAVEAEPQHFDWLNEHVDLNKIDRAKTTLLQAAATGRPGDCWFDASGDPQSWYGQSVRELDAPDDGASEYAQGPHGLMRRTRAVTLTDLVGYEAPLDYVHMDIQGAEFEFLSSAPDLLDQHVKMVNIGTHSLEIERDLRRLFNRLGWSNVLDVQLFSTSTLRVEGQTPQSVTFGDGVQVWTNPRFTAASA